MCIHRGTTILGAVVTALSLPLVLASSAEATSIIGFGNSAHDNNCANRGGALAAGATTHAAGIVTALTAGVPVATPTNQCGDLGSPLIDVGLNNVLNCFSVLGTASCAGNNFQTGGSFEGGLASGGGTLG